MRTRYSEEISPETETLQRRYLPQKYTALVNGALI